MAKKERNISAVYYEPDSMAGVEREVRNVEISRATQLLLCSNLMIFFAIFALAHSIINQIA
jgi:hypothetical protein